VARAGGAGRLIVVAMGLVCVASCSPNAALHRQRAARAACSQLEAYASGTQRAVAADLEKLQRAPVFQSGETGVRGRAVIDALRAGLAVSENDSANLASACADDTSDIVVSAWLVDALILLVASAGSALWAIRRPARAASVCAFGCFVLGAVCALRI
jgi:hypothetical protein